MEGAARAVVAEWAHRPEAADRVEEVVTEEREDDRVRRATLRTWMAPKDDRPFNCASKKARNCGLFLWYRLTSLITWWLTSQLIFQWFQAGLALMPLICFLLPERKAP